MEHAVIVVITL